MAEVKRKFKFFMTIPEEGDAKYKSEWTIRDYDREFEEELDYLLDQFKRFLLACGYSEIQTSRLQYLEDDEWKYVLEKYGKWDTKKQMLYEAYTKRKE